MNILQDNPQGLDGLAQLRRLMESGRRPPIAETLDFDLVEIEAGRAVFAGTPGVQAYNPLGSVHGGYAATLLDSACACAVHSSLAAGQGYTTLELKVAYHRPLSHDTGPVRAEARIITVGKRVAFAEGRLCDAQGRVYASATSTLLVFELDPGG